MLVLALHDLDNLVTVADITAAMSVEGLLGTDDVFADDLQRLRPASRPGRLRGEPPRADGGQRDPASRTAHRASCTRVQDAYSLRCSPQVAGGARDTIAHARTVAGIELASAIDNPVVTPDGRVESNGNFHGAPIAYVLDFLAIVDRRPGQHRRAPDRPVPRPGPQQRPDAVPGRRSRRRLRAHDRPVHPGGDRVRAQAAGRAGLGRLDPQLGHAGGPRLDGLVGGPQAAPGRRRPDPGAGRRAAHRRPRPRAARARSPPPRPPPR